MSLRLEMLQVARLAPRVLGEATELVTAFLQGQLAEEGGFRDRAGRADLYYTAFGLEGLLALKAEVPLQPVAEYLHRFGIGEELDFVHRACLARCWASWCDLARLQQAPAERLLGPGPDLGQRLAALIEEFRTPDGGFNAQPGALAGSAYGAFLGLGAVQDCTGTLPADPERLAGSVKALHRTDGGFASERHLEVSTTNATAAAVAVLRNLRAPWPLGIAKFLLQQLHPQGGFRATADAPIPDLLSTATALHALAGLEVDFDPIREACLDFLDSLWTNAGGFYGHWGDDTLDCEYAFYALLALGHLSV